MGISSYQRKSVQLRAWNGIAGNVTSDSAIALNTWTLITAAIDISSGYVEIYINGTLDVRDTNFTFTSLYNNEPNTLTKIGVYNWTYDGYFDGLIDDVRMYDATLSSSQIKQNYIVGLNSLLAKGNILREEYNQRIDVLGSKF